MILKKTNQTYIDSDSFFPIYFADKFYKYSDITPDSDSKFISKLEDNSPFVSFFYLKVFNQSDEFIKYINTESNNIEIPDFDIEIFFIKKGDKQFLSDKIINADYSFIIGSRILDEEYLIFTNSKENIKNILGKINPWESNLEDLPNHYFGNLLITFKKKEN